jgi:hypothetical protein
VELGYVDGVLQDIGDIPALIENRGVGGAPIPLFEHPAAIGIGPGDIVFDESERVRPLRLDGATDGFTDQPHRGRAVRRGAAGESLEQVAAENLLPAAERGAEIGVVGVRDHHRRCEQHVRVRGGVEKVQSGPGARRSAMQVQHLL